MRSLQLLCIGIALLLFTGSTPTLATSAWLSCCPPPALYRPPHWFSAPSGGHDVVSFHLHHRHMRNEDVAFSLSTSQGRYNSYPGTSFLRPCSRRPRNHIAVLMRRVTITFSFSVEPQEHYCWFCSSTYINEGIMNDNKILFTTTAT